MKALIRNSISLNLFRSAKGLLRSLRRYWIGEYKPDRGVTTVSVAGYCNIFCGYYDKSPFNPADESQVLIHANNASALRNPSPHLPTDILLIEWRTGKIVRNLGTTYSWNWQQGARVHWLKNGVYIYNVYDSSRRCYRALVGRIDSPGTQLLPVPVQDSHSSGLVFSISYEALSRIRPDYGYRNVRCKKEHIYKNQLAVYSIKDGSFSILVTVDGLVKATIRRLDCTISKPKFNHVLVAPSGRHTAFLFRYYAGGTRITDLYLVDVVNGAYRLLLHNHGVSHYCWLDDDRLLFTGRGPGGFGYHVFDINANGVRTVAVFGDGHPVYVGKGLVISDTYPDCCGIRSLYTMDLDSGVLGATLGGFVEPAFIHGERRCDLHPSVSQSRRWVQVDMMRGYRRTIGIMGLQK